MGTVNSNHSTMKFLVVLSAAVAAVQCAAVLPYHGLGYGYGGYGIHAVPAVAKSTIKYKTGAFEKVDVATPAVSFAAHGYGYPYGLIHAAPEVEVKEAEPVELPALHLGGYGYGLGGLGYGYPYGLVHAAPEVEIKEAEPVELPALHLGGYGYGIGGLYGGLG